jgi:hypothetical protein
MKAWEGSKLCQSGLNKNELRIPRGSLWNAIQEMIRQHIVIPTTGYRPYTQTTVSDIIGIRNTYGKTTTSTGRSRQKKSIDTESTLALYGGSSFNSCSTTPTSKIPHLESISPFSSSSYSSRSSSSSSSFSSLSSFSYDSSLCIPSSLTPSFPRGSYNNNNFTNHKKIPMFSGYRIFVNGIGSDWCSNRKSNFKGQNRHKKTGRIRFRIDIALGYIYQTCQFRNKKENCITGKLCDQFVSDPWSIPPDIMLELSKSEEELRQSQLAPPNNSTPVKRLLEHDQGINTDEKSNLSQFKKPKLEVFTNSSSSSSSSSSSTTNASTNISRSSSVGSNSAMFPSCSELSNSTSSTGNNNNSNNNSMKKPGSITIPKPLLNEDLTAEQIQMLKLSLKQQFTKKKHTQQQHKSKTHYFEDSS